MELDDEELLDGAAFALVVVFKQALVQVQLQRVLVEGVRGHLEMVERARARLAIAHAPAQFTI